MEGLTSKPIPFRKERLKTATAVVRVPARVFRAGDVAIQGETVIRSMRFQRNQTAA